MNFGIGRMMWTSIPPILFGKCRTAAFGGYSIELYDVDVDTSHIG
jgi:hypothetical protein